jgi:hypothetical protein
MQKHGGGLAAKLMNRPEFCSADSLWSKSTSGPNPTPRAFQQQTRCCQYGAKHKLYGLNTRFGDLFVKFNPILDSGKPDPKAAHEIEVAIDAFNQEVYAFDRAMQEASAAKTNTCIVREPK